MELNQLWHLLDTQLETIKKEIDASHHPVLEKSFTELQHIFENFLDEQVIPGLPHPHPRSRVYRSDPKTWDIFDISSNEVLSRILDKRKTVSKKPACIFDLDGTLFDVGHRTIGILKEWLAINSKKSFDEALIKKVEKINYDHIGYSLSHAFENAGFDLRNEDMMNFFVEIERTWKKKFFDGESLVKYDHVMENSPQFLKEISNHGIHIAYLTGRYATRMTEGTKAQLKKYDFPFENCDLILKGDIHLEDQIFKAEQVRNIGQKYDVIGNFENEYFNLAFMALEAPNAVHVIVDSQHSGRLTPEISVPVYRIFKYD